MKERFLKWTLTLVIAGVFFYTLYAFYPERGFLLRDENLVDKVKEIAVEPKPVEDTVVLEEETIAAKSKSAEDTVVLKEPTVGLMYVQKDSVRLRSGPGINHRAIGSRRLGDKIFTKDLEGDWYRIVDPKDFNKTIGWIHRSLLGKMPPRP